MIYAFETPRNSRKRDWVVGRAGGGSIDDTVLYYFMPASIEKESVR